jgi:hypothetical protein
MCVLNVVDYLTTSIALSRFGLVESNLLLLEVSNRFGTSVLGTLEIVKVGFVAGVGILVLIGIKSNNRLTKKIMFWSIVAFVSIFLLVLINNILWIVD